MKKYILIILTVIAVNSFAQKSEIVIDTADNKAAIFSKSLLWVAKNWKDANNVIQMKDESSGTIVIKGGMQSTPKALGMPVKGITMTTLTILIKDGKAKLTFEGTYFKWASGPLWSMDEPKSAGQYERWATAVNEEMETLIAEYKKAITAASDF